MLALLYERGPMGDSLQSANMLSRFGNRRSAKVSRNSTLCRWPPGNSVKPRHRFTKRGCSSILREGTTNAGMPNRSIVVILLSALVPIATCEAAPRGRPNGYDPLGDPFYNHAQSEYRAVWIDFNSTVEALLKTIGATNVEAAALLVQVQTNASFLDVKWEAWYRKHFAPTQYAAADGYLESLRGDLRLLHRVKKLKEGEESMDVLRDVALDMQLKGDNCRNPATGSGRKSRSGSTPKQAERGRRL